jgi:hypothetical protein
MKYQYSETYVMQFLLNLSRIKSLYMFRTLLVHLQEALNKRHFVYCVRVMSVGCTCCCQRHNTHAIYSYQVLFVEQLLRMSK